MIETDISSAVDALRRGDLVAFPTETVYGLGADATNLEALKRLYKVKGRPTNHPVIVHLAGMEQINDWAEQVPDAAFRLAEAFWPGPMTLVLRRAAHVLDHVTGGQDSVALRIPNHPVAQALLAAFAGGVAAPSANRFGRLSPTSAEHVRAEIGDDVAMVLDGGPCLVGIESTIVDLTGGRPRILRPGMLLPEQLEEALGHKGHLKTLDCADESPRIRAPGGLPSHYAPVTPLKLVDNTSLAEEISTLVSSGRRGAVLSFQPPSQAAPGWPWVTAAPDPRVYAQDLYRQLRFLDHQGCQLILVEAVPDHEAWYGIRDRLKRASQS